MKNVYYFPDKGHEDDFFGDGYPVCFTREELDFLSHEWGNGILEYVHEATREEIEKFGVEQ